MDGRCGSGAKSGDHCQDLSEIATPNGKSLFIKSRMEDPYSLNHAEFCQEPLRGGDQP